MSEASQNNNYNRAAFSGRQQSLSQFQDAVVVLLPDRLGLRILDLGCGAGDLVFGLKSARPDLTLTGIDISSVNIEAAKRRLPAGGTDFVESDYFAWQGTASDVILAESVLHLLVGEDHDLARKLASDLVPGGLLILTMPLGCTMNSLLLLQRKVWRVMPRAADALAVAAGKVVYRNEPPQIIEERVQYLRVIPERLHGPEFVAQMKSCGLGLIKDEDWPSASFFKLRHRFLVFRREF